VNPTGSDVSRTQEPHLRLEVGHILFLDIVGYSKLLSDEQKELVQQLNQIVRETEQFRAAEAEGKLTRLPTGDGMVLVFTNNPEAPVECALEICKALQSHAKLKLRMGIHSGPVNPVADVNDQSNLLGAGINVAQRVMSCGDAGHILLSKNFAEHLQHYAHWRSNLHDVGEVTSKHGLKVPLVNLYTDQLGNSALPAKLKRARTAFRLKSAAVAALLLIMALGIGFWMFRRSQERFTNAFALIPEKSIAVLPFENLSEDKANAYFAAGIQDEILTRIARIGTLKVISRVSTQQYPPRPTNLPEIAHELGVANILEGSVQKAENLVHVNVQLIRAATDEHLWAESYDRKLENIFGIESEVASAVAEALKVKLSGVHQPALEQKPTSNPEAYQAYLRGIALYGEAQTADDEFRAKEAFEEAVRLDPNFALAWAMLSRLNSDGYAIEGKPTYREAAKKALENAMRLQPELAETQVAQAFYQMWVLRDNEGARPIFERLLTQLPNDADVPGQLAMITLKEGRWNETSASLDKAIGLNPRERILRLQAAFVRETVRDFPGALRYYDEALDIWPEDPYLVAGKAEIYQLLGDLNRADALLKNVHPTTKNYANAGLDQIWYQAKLRRSYSDTIRFLTNFLEQVSSLPFHRFERGSYRRMLGDLQRLSGDTKNADASYVQARHELEELLKEQPDDADSIYRELARVYAGLVDKQQATSCIERAINLKPASKDAWEGPRYEETQARIAARFGQKDLAIPILERLLKTSYCDPITPAVLRLDPDFDSLRDDPRFQKLVEEQQKPVAFK
jgi:TolB-like protein/class 3 adenylate cyclase